MFHDLKIDEVPADDLQESSFSPSDGEEGMCYGDRMRLTAQCRSITAKRKRNLG